jgi:hypothetical protein
MRLSRTLAVLLLVAPALGACIPLPAVDLAVRSTWRQRPEQNGRAVELLAGVMLGWAGGTRRRASAGVFAADGFDEAPTSLALAVADDVTPCADAELCRWELDARDAALTRAAQEWP